MLLYNETYCRDICYFHIWSNIFNIKNSTNIVFYLMYRNLLFSNQIDIFQLTMLFMYITLQLLLLFLGVYVLRIHWWMWHISPGSFRVFWDDITSKQIMNQCNKFYDEVALLPEVNRIVLKIFGDDIGNVVMYYLTNIEV